MLKISATLPALMIFAIGAFAASPALAAEAPAKHLTPQQQKMATCSHEAGEKALKGDERRAFLSTCLKGDGAVAATSTEKSASADAAAQSRKQSCRAEAKRQHLSGEARKTFIVHCAGDRPADIAAR